jgi:hypothetical protein
MITETIQEGAQGVDVLGNMQTIGSEEELKKYLEGQGAESAPENAAAQARKKADEEAAAAAAAAAKKDKGGLNIDPLSSNVTEEEEDAEGKKKEDKEEEEPVNYPTVLHYLNDKHELGLKLEEVKELSKEEEAEALDGLISRMVENTNAALQEYGYIEQLMQDPEIREVLRAKIEGKTLKDLYSQFSASPAGQADDALAMQNFKKQYPKAPEEAIQGMVDALKKSGQFEPFVKGLREQLIEEQSLNQKQQAEAEKKRLEEEALKEQQEVQQYAQYLETIPAVYGIPLTKEMKEAIFDITTSRDQKGFTRLDYALQSNDGLVLAALGIGFMKQMIANGASIQKNKSKGRVMDKIFPTPESLQSGGSGGKQDPEEDIIKSGAANLF